MTDYVATRWYRAPELLLSWKEYSTAVDVWSVGCIFAELLKRKPFLPGVDTKNQIELIIDYFGTPTEQEINNVPKEKSRQLLKTFPIRKAKNLETIFNQASPLAIDLLKNLLTFDPSKRITVDEALCHPYLKDLHSEDDEVFIHNCFLFAKKNPNFLNFRKNKKIKIKFIILFYLKNIFLFLVESQLQIRWINWILNSRISI